MTNCNILLVLLKTKTKNLIDKKKIAVNPVFFTEHLPEPKKVLAYVKTNPQQALVLCDKRFKNHPPLDQWRKNPNMDFYYVNSGETSKSLEHLPRHIEKILSLDRGFKKNSFLFISFGGGSLNDLTGFLASIYKRGREVIHFPTTWLSALDSAHGGKTAINFQNTKNVIGSWLFPKAVFIVKDFLRENPPHLKQEAFGEILKMAWLEGGVFYNKLKRLSLNQKKAFACQNLPLEKFLKVAVKAKLKIVQRDPFETRSIRRKLNLGHTVGHVLEAFHKIPHGEAVLRGLDFCLCFSLEKGLASKKHFEDMKSLLPPQKKLKKIPPALFKKLIMTDKKGSGPQGLNFVFIKKPGQVVSRPVIVKDILYSAQKQGLIQ